MGKELRATLARDMCAVNALTLALRHLGSTIGVVDADGNVVATRRSQDIEYIRETLALYAGITSDLPKERR